MKKVLFVSGTRADYGKMKSLMNVLEQDDDFEVYVFVCGMHLYKKYGSTFEEVVNDGYKNIHIAYGLAQSEDASINLGNTIAYLSGYINNVEPDMIIVHGDRIDALAGAVVGALHNIMVGHIEGGELSGTIDESIRHAISKFAHIHFVCNDEAKKRLTQLGEDKNNIYVIGSPDIDIMLKSDLPSKEDAFLHYDIDYERYAILMYHPVTTEYDLLREHIKIVVDAVQDSKMNYIVIYPNNDLGSEIIINEYNRLSENDRFRIYPSIRFEYFLALLKNAEFIIGNSSAGIREAEIYTIPSIDIGSRQLGRYQENNTEINHVDEDYYQLQKAISNVSKKKIVNSNHFGDGQSTERFHEILRGDEIWKTSLQKKFFEI